jgi:predicted transcriptional regulator
MYKLVSANCLWCQLATKEKGGTCLNDIFKINYDAFSDEVIEQLSKVITVKCKEQAIIILDYLKDRQTDIVMKKNLRSLFKNHFSTVDKWIETLEDTLCITYQEVVTSNVYKITPIGIKMLNILKGESANE